MYKFEASHIMHLMVKCSDALCVGNTKEGYLRVFPITGGYFEGEKLKGEIVPGGADWNTKIGENLSHAFAKYLIKTDDGEYIEIENEGYMSDCDSVFKTAPKFHAANDGKYGFLNEGVYVGKLVGAKDPDYAVEIDIYKMG